MASKFRNKFRIESARLRNGDYRRNAAYFITICTTNREHFFGEIKEGKMLLSKTGVIADILWNQIPIHTPVVKLGEYVVVSNPVNKINFRGWFSVRSLCNLAQAKHLAMKWKNNIWIKRLGNRYLLVGLAFAIWMLFLDANSFMVHHELDQELGRMEENIRYYEKELEVIREQLQALESDPEKLEKFAREEFYMHREGEEIYLVK